MAALVGFAVTVVDPRSSFATEARFPGVRAARAWPDEALRELALDRRTALRHAHPRSASSTIPRSPRRCARIASTSARSASAQDHAARLERLRKARLRRRRPRAHPRPGGPPIGAASPAEIAVSMLAEVIQRLRADAE